MTKILIWDEIEKDVEVINKIAEKCHDSVKEKCFELLFNLKFKTVKTPTTNDESDQEEESEQYTPPPPPHNF